MRVKLRGVIYESVQDAAKAYNLTVRTIQRIVSEGRENTIRKKRDGCKRGRPQPFTIEGITFPNQTAANDALGFPYNYVTQAVNKNSAAMLGKVAAAALMYKEKKKL